MRRVLIALLLTACAAEQPITDTSATVAKPPRPAAPSAADAKTLIANAPEFSEFEFTNAGWTTPVSGSLMSTPVRDEARQLAEAGWIALDRMGDVMLTNKSRNDKRFLLRPNGILDVVPLAKKEIGDVVAVRDREGEVTVDFTWRWIPNEVGTAFKTGAVHDRFAAPQQATATLLHEGTGWSVLRIDRR
jgi:hypothetical protein